MDDVATKVKSYFSTYPKRTYPTGHILIFADENPSSVYFLVSGKVRKYDISYRGEEIIVNIFRPPAFFPMSWAIDRMQNKFFYKTEEETTLHVIPADDALAFLKANPDVMLDLLTRIYRGMEGVFGRLVHLMSGTARSRLIYELIVECRRFGKPDTTGKLRITITESDLAARSGLSRETISREMSKLHEHGYATVTYRGIIINDIASLEQSLGTAI